jgi:phosphomannomutase/phosphoglucomutase
VVDAGNGTGGVIAVPLYREMGFDVIPLFCEPDGHFPNHHPDPTVPENMQSLIEKVALERADLGIAFDGDVDRIGVVDELGNIIWGDQLMIIFSRSILKESPGATFIGEVKCSQTLFDDIAKNGGNPIMWKVGHSLIKAKMKEERALLAGEMSGHLFFADRYFGYDDAIYAGARLLEILSHDRGSLSARLSDIPKMVNTPEIRIECPEDKKFRVVEQLVDELKREYHVIDIDGARVLFPDGWGLVRASNTQAILVLRFEASNQESLRRIQDLIMEKLNSLLE